MIVELSDGTQVECADEPLSERFWGTTCASKDGKHEVIIFRNPHPDQRSILEAILGTYNVAVDDARWKQLMCWPEGIVIKPGLGVLLPCAPAGMDRLTWIIYPKLYDRLPPENKHWDKRVLTALRLAAALARMHRCGVAHGNLGPQEILVDPLTGGVYLINLDGIVVPGFLPPRILGTPDYQAPEVISGKAPPSISTDRHALAVILYQLLLFRHPFRGPKVYSQDSDEDETLMLGESAVFIDHPHDTSNRPTKKFWPLTLLGNTLKDLFERAFISGLKDPTCRPTAGEWQSALARLLDRIIGCGNEKCDEKYFPVREGKPISCPWCNAPFVAPEGIPTLRLYSSDPNGQFRLENDWWIAGYPDRCLHSWHVETGTEWSPGLEATPVAKIVADQGKWFLLNRGLNHLRMIEHGTLGKQVALEERIELVEGLALMLARPPRGRLAYVQWIR